jgi:amino acid transporter
LDQTAAVAAELVHEGELRKELRLRDLVPMQLLLVIGVTWSGIAAKQGSGHPMMWIAGVLFFFLPQVAVVTYCARLWPLEGGVYQWAKFAFGPLVGFLSAWNYAFYAVLLVSGIGIQAVTSLSYALGPSAGWMKDSLPLTFAFDGGLFALILGVNVVGLKLGRWVTHFGAGVVMVLTAMLMVLLVWHPGATAAHPHVSPQRPFAFGWPVWSILTLNLYIKVAFNALSGLEQVAVFAGETKDAARSVMLSAWIAAPAVVVIYVLMTSSMLTYVPSSQIDLAGPIPQVLAAALGSGAGVWLGRVMILGLMLFLVASYIIVVAETSRLPMVAGWDRMLPGWFSRVSPRFHTPVRSLIVIVAISGVASVLASIGTGREEAFQVLQNSNQISFGLYYCAMFAVPLAVGDRFGERAGFWLKVSAVLGLAVTMAEVVLTTVPIVEVNSTWGFAAKVIAAAVGVNLVGIAVYVRGRRLSVAI